jgi:hypothetical protein
MTRRHVDSDSNVPAGANPAYAAFQVAKALTTSVSHRDAATRERSREKIATWTAVLENIFNGSLAYGSRTPVDGAPSWATLEVVTGGFATGALLAGGPLHAHEKALLEVLPAVPPGDERRALNAYYLTDEGLAALQEMLRTGCYDVTLPEEGALLAVAWLAQNGHLEEARALIDALAPYFSKLRFYPVPLQQPRYSGSRVHVQTVGGALENVRRIAPNSHVLAQKAAAEVWAPHYDKMVALFLETVEDGWPCQRYPSDWRVRAAGVLGEYATLEKMHGRPGKLARTSGHAAQLRGFLERCARSPEGLTGREVGRIRLILNSYVEKRGTPGSQKCAETRHAQAMDVAAPTFYEIARVVAARLEVFRKDDGLDDVSMLTESITAQEAKLSGVAAGVAVPASIRHKVERCLNDTVAALIERGLITSGDMLAAVLPQMTSGLRATSITDPALRQLYAAIYRAFRRRRSLLLLNLEKQVQIGELPWLAAIDRFRRDSLPDRELARLALEELTTVALTSFPHAIFPNKLLQEMRMLVQSAGLDIPLVDELAADIFMGEFSDKFVEAARRAAQLLGDSLYARYYDIAYDEIANIPKADERPARKRLWGKPVQTSNSFAEICASRAGVKLGMWVPATNGMVIEQQQILTTQNLAALVGGLGLHHALRDRLDEMARHCFMWICRRQQMNIHDWHGRLIMVKNTAYGWRQMIFFLALLPPQEVDDFLRWAKQHLEEQSEWFQRRFSRVLRGLALAVKDEQGAPDAQRFLGWTDGRHWLLAEAG